MLKSFLPAVLLSALGERFFVSRVCDFFTKSFLFKIPDLVHRPKAAQVAEKIAGRWRYQQSVSTLRLSVLCKISLLVLSKKINNASKLV